MCTMCQLKHFSWKNSDFKNLASLGLKKANIFKVTNAGLQDDTFIKLKKNPKNPKLDKLRGP